MLHGEIKVNHNEIALWQAVRIEPLLDKNDKPMPQWYVYRCRVEYRDTRGYPRDTGPFLVHHHFNDGALVLASKVVSQAQILFDTIDAG